jgi:pimeloyl-ACP methyl ester carboxylesterase
MSNRCDQSILLHDGRKLGYAELGDPQGMPLLHFHGFPGSRYEGLPMDKPGKKKGVRIIVPDRPGQGLSTFKPGRKMTDWPQDIMELADSLELDRFAVTGVSGGGPYALVCAWKIPERLTSITVIAGMGPLNVPDAMEGMKTRNIRLFDMARKSPWKLYPIFWIEKVMWTEKTLKKVLTNIPEADRRIVVGELDFLQVMLEAGKHAFIQGVRGAVHEAVLYANPWGFALNEIQSKVHLWQGEADMNVPLAMGRYQARTLPNCVQHFMPGEGHYSLALMHLDEILESAMNP